MLTDKHFLFGLLFSFFLYYVFPKIGIFSLVVFMFATVFIDIDHYLYYVYRKRDWNFKKAIRWDSSMYKIFKKLDKKTRQKSYDSFYFFHGVEPIFISFILGYYTWDVFYFIGFGIGFHLCLDYIEHIRIDKRFDRLSLIHNYFKFKKLKFIEEFK